MNDLESLEYGHLSDRMAAIEKAARAIQERNRKVEGEKAWETSAFRAALIAALTFLITAAVFGAVGAPKVWSSALIPTTGYIISTLTIPWVKRWWLRRNGY